VQVAVGIGKGAGNEDFASFSHDVVRCMNRRK
jgi:hypothetical protein